MWTQFWDMHSGGGLKEPPYAKIYIEAPEEEAIRIFEDRFGRDPYNVTCDCCGDDYSIDSEETLEELTGYHRGCGHIANKKTEDGRWQPLPEGMRTYLERDEEPPEGFIKTESWKGDYQTLEEYVEREDVLVIRREDIKP